jgi:hypothetical protein
MANFDETVELDLSSVFSSPKNEDDTLQVVYGDHTLKAENNGLVECVEISLGDIFLVSDSPVFAITDVYDGDGKIIEEAEYSVVLDGSFEGRDNIAYLDFVFTDSGAPEDFDIPTPITVQCVGKVDDSGNVIENPVEVIKDFLIDKGGWIEDDFAATTTSEAINRANNLGQKIRWCFDEDQPASQWILDIMFQVFGNALVGPDGRVALGILSEVDHAVEQNAVAHIVAKRDCTEGNDGPTFTVDEANIVTRIIVNYNYSWAEGDTLSRLELTNDEVDRNYDVGFTKEIELKGMYSDATVNLLAQRVLDDFNLLRSEYGIFTFTVKGMKAAQARFGDLLGFTWPWGPGGAEFINRFVKIFDVTDNHSEGTQTITARETGLAIVDIIVANGTITADGSETADPPPSQRIRP